MARQWTPEQRQQQAQRMAARHARQKTDQQIQFQAAAAERTARAAVSTAPPLAAREPNESEAANTKIDFLSDFLARDYKLPRRTKRFHAKSRAGCTQCKQQRLKCDERKPTCSRCATNHSNCTYTPVSTASTQDEASSTSTSMSTSTSSTSSTTVTPPEPETVLATSISMTYDDLSVADTVLLELYREKVSIIHTRPSVAAVAGTMVVDLAFEFPYLLHALLASAAHMKAVSAPPGGPVYHSALAQAAEHENESMALFREHVKTVTKENYEAVFIFTMMAALFVYCSFSVKLHPEAPRRYHELTKSGWLRTLHGMTLIVPQEAWAWIPTSPVFVFTFAQQWGEPPAPQDPVFLQMRAQFSRLSQLWNEHELSDMDMKKIYDTALTNLLKTLDRIAVAYLPDADPETTLPVGPACGEWLHKLSDDLLVPLDQGDVPALILLAYWGVLQCKTWHAYWVDGMGANLVRTIWMELDRREKSAVANEWEMVKTGKWREWMEWPMEMIRT